MPDIPEGTQAETLAVEPLRLRVPSQIGVLGIEFRDEVVTRLVIKPAPKERYSFTAFAEVKPTDFLDEALGQLSEYFAGARRNLNLEYDLGPSDLDGFSRRVLRETAKVPYGRTRTYQEIGEAAGRPDAYRQVLAVLMVNPIPIFIPCHRIVTFKSGIGSYIAGEQVKAWLLRAAVRDLFHFRGGGDQPCPVRRGRG